MISFTYDSLVDFIGGKGLETLTKGRSSHQKCSMKKDVLKNFTKFTGKHLCQSLFLNRENLLKKGLWHRCFPVSFAKFLGTPFFTEHLQWLFSGLANREVRRRKKNLSILSQLYLI